QLVTIHHVVTSNLAVDGVTNFAGITVPDVTVDVEDNDVAGVLIQESGGSTRVIEADGSVVTAGGSPFIDSYTVVLTKPLTGTETVTVHVQPGVTQTGGTISQTFSGGPLQSFTLAQVPVLVARVTVDGHQLSTAEYNVAGAVVTILTALRTGAQVAVNYRVAGSAKQVLVSTSQNGAYTDGLDLVFTAADWNVARTVWVKAIDDAVIDGDGIEVFAPAARTTAGIQGPLFVEGGVDLSGGVNT